MLSATLLFEVFFSFWMTSFTDLNAVLDVLGSTYIPRLNQYKINKRLKSGVAYLGFVKEAELQWTFPSLNCDSKIKKKRYIKSQKTS
jgi:hypothetical protein